MLEAGELRRSGGLGVLGEAGVSSVSNTPIVRGGDGGEGAATPPAVDGGGAK